MLRRFSVLGGNKSYEMTPSLSTDFNCAPDGSISHNELLSDPRYCLYAVDPDTRLFSFVRTKEVLAPTEHAFLYLPQYHQAESLVVASADEMLELAERVSLDAERVVFLHSTGRCGSTLISRALGLCPGVVSVSEPDVFTRLPELRPRDRLDDEKTAALCEAAVKLTFHALSPSPSTTVILKGRSQIMEIADLLHRRMPAAQAVFLYRDAVSWLESFMASLLRAIDFTREENANWERSMLPTHPVMDEYVRPDDPLSPGELWTLDWVSSMEAFLQLQSAGARALPVRFDEIQRDAGRVVGALVGFLKLQPPSKERLLDLLSRDSQEGTPIEKLPQSRVAEERYLDQCRTIVQGRPKLRTPDLLLPGTLRLNPEGA